MKRFLTNLFKRTKTVKLQQTVHVTMPETSVCVDIIKKAKIRLGNQLLSPDNIYFSNGILIIELLQKSYEIPEVSDTLFDDGLNIKEPTV